MHMQSLRETEMIYKIIHTKMAELKYEFSEYHTP